MSKTEGQRCELCGAQVRVVSSGEGTSYYAEADSESEHYCRACTRPFSCGDELYAWLDANCSSPCPAHNACMLEDAIWEAYYGAGTVSAEVAAAIGYSDELRARLGWPCQARTLAPRAKP